MPNSNNKSVSFGGVFHFPTLPRSNRDAKEAEAEGKTVAVKNRFNCGSLRNSLKMVGSNGSTLIAIRLVRSKLRKREDSLPTTTATPPTTATTTTSTATNNNNNNVIQQSNNLSNHLQQHLNNSQQQLQQNHVQLQQQQQQQQQSEADLPPFLWVYHTNGNSTTASSQYTLYNNDQDSLVHNLQCEEPRECKGFRKNLRGKWRRLVKKKPQQEVYTIPAELRDQLKQIYVY